LIALFIPNNAYQNLHLHEFPLIKENKYKIGAVSKYDIPQYIREIPEEYSAFCTIKEAGKLKNIKIREEKDKKKKIQMELEINNIKKDKENNTSSNIIKNKNNKNNSKNINITTDKKGNFNNNIEELEEPIPNEMHKYCHLCKKQFDNYLRHIYSKNHKDNTLKYTDTFKSIKNVFNRINTFWENKKDNNESNINSTTTSHNLNEIEEKIEFETDTNNSPIGLFNGSVSSIKSIENVLNLFIILEYSSCISFDVIILQSLKEIFILFLLPISLISITSSSFSFSFNKCFILCLILFICKVNRSFK
jgi:hypothetical protein